MSVRHLSKGSTVPPYTGKLRVYSMRFCPFAQRTILVLNAKKIDYEVVNVNLSEKPEWLTSKSPLGKVPSLEIAENVVITESLITSEYLEDKYPSPQLVSSDPLRKAQDKLIVENFSRDICGVFHKILTEPITGAIESSILTGLKDLQATLEARSTKFLYGDYPGLVDYMIWPWIERMSLIHKFTDKITIDKAAFKTLVDWAAAMKQDPAVKAHLLDVEQHYTFIKGRLSGNPDYDFLV